VSGHFWIVKSGRSTTLQHRRRRGRRGSDLLSIGFWRSGSKGLSFFVGVSPYITAARMYRTFLRRPVLRKPSISSDRTKTERQPVPQKLNFSWEIFVGSVKSYNRRIPLDTVGYMPLRYCDRNLDR